MIITIFLISLIVLIISLTFKSWACEAIPYNNYYGYNPPSNEDRITWKKQHSFKQKLYMADFNDETGWWLVLISGTVLVLSLAFGIGIFASYSGAFVIDDKIAIYEEENIKIEDRINTIVTEYQNYEQETFSSLKADGVDMVFAMYPELKSNDLVVSQINLYIENNKKIKELKEQKLDYRLMRWALIFF